jgi:hypothetical protein
MGTRQDSANTGQDQQQTQRTKAVDAAANMLLHLSHNEAGDNSKCTAPNVQLLCIHAC